MAWDAAKQGAFAVALAEDRQHRIWIGTEDLGLWSYDPNVSAKERWTQYTQKNGLGDEHVYALAIDGKGRVWAGHSHGVSVFNGREWKTYGLLDGLAGERVFAIALNGVAHPAGFLYNFSS